MIALISPLVCKLCAYYKHFLWSNVTLSTV
nr:MAG TPA: hypothetical protein [Crassvirales sp.]